MALLGTVIPWIFFGEFFLASGFDLFLFAVSLFPNGAAGGFSADVVISILVFWVWSYQDAKHGYLHEWWIGVAGSFLAGLSLALPLYLFMKEGRKEKSVS